MVFGNAAAVTDLVETFAGGTHRILFHRVGDAAGERGVDAVLNVLRLHDVGDPDLTGAERKGTLEHAPGGLQLQVDGYQHLVEHP